MEHKSFLLDIKKIRVPENRGRREFKNLKTLMNSMQRLGLAHPLVVAPKEELFELIAGERRYRSAILLGWTQIACTLRSDLSPIEQKELELEENIHREDLLWSEEIEITTQIDELKRELFGETLPGSNQKGWTQQKTADLIGKSKPFVSKQIKFAKLLRERPDIKEKIKDLPLNTALKQADMELQKERLERLQENNELEFLEEIQLGNCLKLINKVDSNSVDLLLTDPPFGIASDKMEGKKASPVESYKSVLKPNDNSTLGEVITLMENLVLEIVRVLKPARNFYIFFTPDLYPALVNMLKIVASLWFDPTPIIWNKGRTTTPFRGYTYTPCYEMILFGGTLPRTHRLNGPAKKILDFSPISSKNKTHPFQKPQLLLRFLIEQSTNLGDLVLDPFAGSGSTLLAAKNLGRGYLGFELDNDHFMKAQSLLLDQPLEREYCKHDNNPETCHICKGEKSE